MEIKLALINTLVLLLIQSKFKSQNTNILSFCSMRNRDNLQP
ncbi:hypothetical protein FDUTEX481_07454 [Tolypothrix sp. PCC 7601]|nr:hypothetical protein FDUTEX481_07454 [Tolypothrix sp. PCC 7601]